MTTTLTIMKTIMVALLAAEGNTLTVDILGEKVTGTAQDIMLAVKDMKEQKYATFNRSSKSVTLTEAGVGYAQLISAEEVQQPIEETTSEVVEETVSEVVEETVSEVVEDAQVIGVSPEVAPNIPSAPVVGGAEQDERSIGLAKYHAWAQADGQNATNQERIRYLIDTCGIMPIDAVKIINGKAATQKTSNGGGRAQDPNSKTAQFEKWMYQNKHLPRSEMIEYAVSVLGIAQAAAGTFVYNYNKKCKEAGVYGVSGDIKPTKEQWMAHLATERAQANKSIAQQPAHA